MEQVYWLSTPTEEGTDTRQLVYRYGNFVYAGPVITEPVAGLEYLPGVLQGIQAVQGQIPYLCEYKDLPADSPQRTSLRALEAAIDSVHAEVTAAEPRLAELAETGGCGWLNEDDVAVYFEFEARPDHTCNGSDVVFAKTYRGDVLLTVIWYGPANSYYVSLSPAGGEEQALVDTLFPSIYGKRRGVNVCTYEPPAGLPKALAAAYNGTVPVAAALAALAATGGGADSKAEERGAAAGVVCLPPWKLFSKLSVWEASEPVPDPDEVRDRDELVAAAAEVLAVAAAVASAMAGDGKDDDMGVAIGSPDLEAGDGGGAGAAAAAAPATIDLSGGTGYTQVYMVMKNHVGIGANGLYPREGLFRFGDWIYAGPVDFPVEALRLADVPHVLPALQKQQGRLGYLSEARAFPLDHPLCPVVRTFMAAVSLLQHEMEDAQDEVAALAEQSINAWIDADWAASFFELSLVPSSLPEAIEDVDVIACKIYMTQGSGIVLQDRKSVV